MSIDKDAARKKRYEAHLAIERRHKLHLARFGDALKGRGKGRLRKLSPFTCGIPLCPLCCNPRRLKGSLTLQEKRALQGFKDELDVL